MEMYERLDEMVEKRDLQWNYSTDRSAILHFVEAEKELSRQEGYQQGYKRAKNEGPDIL